ncbi:hypothetical protein ACFW1A_19600 [Kitasatospora sp. NPDC058965]|uniref:hypothetical protein n=1 Tax=Kitasatospora sp. NPDC058965 TaxID=3346682 RepID=UPI0036769144
MFVPAGPWPLPALLAAGAAGPAPGELKEALGARAAEAVPGARRLLATRPGATAALGPWTAAGWVSEPTRWRPNAERDGDDTRD